MAPDEVATKMNFSEALYHAVSMCLLLRKRLHQRSGRPRNSKIYSLVQEFYTGIVQHINSLLFSVSDNVLQSLEDHNGVLRGPVSAQLRHLVMQLEQLNFVGDERVEQQIARLQAVLPSPEESEKAAKGLAKIDTARIGTVVRALQREAEQILVDLGSQPKPRAKRQDAAITDGEGLLDLGTQRKARPGAVLSSEQDEGKSRRRRTRASTIQSL